MKRLVAFCLALALTVGVGRQAAALPVLTGNLTADNAFFVYLSSSPSTLGTLIGSGTAFNTSYAITPQALQFGRTYYLNVEAINTDIGQAWTPAGLLGAFSLTSGATFANNLATVTTGSGNGWTANYNNGNGLIAAQSWVQPTSTSVVDLGANGVSPWGSVTGITSAAHWIWAADSLSENPAVAFAAGQQCGACTVDFQIQITTPVPEPTSLPLFALAAAGLAWTAHRRRLV